MRPSRHLGIVSVTALLAAFLAAAAPSSGATPASGACSLSAHDAAHGLSEFDLVCGSAIRDNGSVTITINRSGCEQGCDPTDAEQPPSSDFFCTSQGFRKSGKDWEHLVCEGSLDAGTQAVIRQRLRTPTRACDVPTFKGSYVVKFGDGTSTPNAALDAYTCTAASHKRTITLWATPAKPGGGLGYVGTIKVVGKFSECVSHVPIVIQRKSHGRWVKAWRATTTKMDGDGEANFNGTVPARAGSPPFRAHAAKLVFGNQTCTKANRVGGIFSG